MYTLRQAAKATGKSKSAIQNAVKNGSISANKNEHGHYQIDAAELFRVYPRPSSRTDSEPGINGQYRPPVYGQVDIENTVRIKELEVELKYANKRIDDLEDERNSWRRQAETLLLGSSRQSKNSFWNFVLPKKQEI